MFTDSFTITSEMLKPILDSVNQNLAFIWPFGLAIFAILVGVALVPRIISWFFR